jgi:hypothetical protein
MMPGLVCDDEAASISGAGSDLDRGFDEAAAQRAEGTSLDDVQAEGFRELFDRNRWTADALLAEELPRRLAWQREMRPWIPVTDRGRLILEVFVDLQHLPFLALGALGPHRKGRALEHLALTDAAT